MDGIEVMPLEAFPDAMWEGHLAIGLENQNKPFV